VQIRAFTEQDTEQVVALWHRCELTRPWNDPHKDIKRKLQVGRELFLVGTVEDNLMACIMGGYEGHRGWINYLAVDPDWHGNTAVQQFYESLGFADDKAMSMGKRLIPDN